jgi:hypothetical protein
LHDEIRPLKGNTGIVQQATKDVSGVSERKRSDHSKGSRGQRHRKKIALHDAHLVLRPMEAVSESLRPHRVDFDSDDINRSLGKSDSDRANISTDLDDELAWPKVGLGDEPLSKLGTEEILTETASSLVPGCPPMGGHGRSP